MPAASNFDTQLKEVVVGLLKKKVSQYGFMERAAGSKAVVEVLDNGNGEYFIIVNAAHDYIYPDNFYSTNTNDVLLEDITVQQSIRTEHITAWNKFITLLKRSFNNDAPLNDIDYLEEGGIPTAEKMAYEQLLKRFFALQGRAAFVLFRNNHDFIRKYELGTQGLYAQHLRAVYKERYLPDYYAIAENILVSKGLKTHPNEVEKYVAGTIVYHSGPGNFINISKTLSNAINSHNVRMLTEVVNNANFYDNNRRTKVRSFINNEMVGKNVFKNT